MIQEQLIALIQTYRTPANIEDLGSIFLIDKLVVHELYLRVVVRLLTTLKRIDGVARGARFLLFREYVVIAVKYANEESSIRHVLVVNAAD